MVNQYSPSYFCTCYDLQTKENYETRTFENVSVNALLDVIKINEPIRYKHYWYYNCDALGQKEYTSEIRRICYYKKWRSEINNAIKLIIESSLSSFAIKLSGINCGSLEDKKCFLDAISGKIASDYPFKIINDLMINFVDKKVSEVTLCYAKKEATDIANSKDRSYNELKHIIYKKVEEITNEEDIKLELIASISDVISSFDKKQCVKEELSIHFGVYNMNTTPFVIFNDLYNSHLAKNYDFVISKSIEIFENIGRDEESCMSFVFDKLFGEIVIHHNAVQLRNFIHMSEFYLIELLKDLLSSRKIKFFNASKSAHSHISILEYSSDFMYLINESRKKLEEQINYYMTKCDTVVIERGTVTACGKDSMEKILYYSSRHLEEKITAYIRNKAANGNY